MLRSRATSRRQLNWGQNDAAARAPLRIKLRINIMRQFKEGLKALARSLIAFCSYGAIVAPISRFTTQLLDSFPSEEEGDPPFLPLHLLLHE